MQRFWRLLIPFFLLFLVLFGTAWLVRPIWAVDWQSKVDPTLLELQRSQSAEFLIILDEQADLSHIPSHWTKEQKGQAVYEALTAIADATQPRVLADLGRSQIDAQRFWITNMILVQGDSALVEQMARRPDVGRIASNQPFHFPQPIDTDKTQHAQRGVDWGVSKVNAETVWEMGYTGQGVVVAGQDTGYDWDHPALKATYRGWNGTTVDHNYSWHDSIHSGGGICGADSPEPCDDHGHGTHTAGTMVGNDLASSDPNWPAGAPNAVGVAPGAEWIGCRNMNIGWGTPATYSECYQWFIAPTDVAGNNPDPTKAPHVINNSWGCPTIEGCTSPTIMLGVVQSVRAAGIINVSSAGNSGAGCSTVSTPAAIYDEVFTVGSTTPSDAISGFSSRGPVTIDGSNRLKPDISAPGQGIYSSSRGGGYHSSSGTSMAAPHVAGVVALILSAEPRLAGHVDLIEQVIRDSAVELTTGQTCGTVAGSSVPNAVFGYGRIDAYAAVSRTLNLATFLDTTTTASIASCGNSTTVPVNSTATIAVQSCTVLKNSGFLTLSQHTITDSLGNVSTFNHTIRPGETYTYTKVITVTPPVIVQAVWEATTPTGEQFTKRLDAIEVTHYRLFFPFAPQKPDTAIPYR